ncbi:UNVERIFIED_CONTAM: glycoside hydrolase family 6 protein [Kocuria sp. CPCC 205316]|uniref:glycoside hydrolase family 6 protein n=1 Tax=Kocuria TaxID=57493 RepID=UPI0036D9FDF6
MHFISLFLGLLARLFGSNEVAKTKLAKQSDIDAAVKAHDENPNAHGGIAGGGVTDAEAQAKANAALAAAKADATTKDGVVLANAAADATAKANTAEANAIAEANEKYVKPPGGIPSSDLNTAVQESLAKADSAIQTGTAVTSVNGQTGDVVLDETGTPIGDASSTGKGVVRLTGDLGGTADSPTVPGLASKLNSATYTAGMTTKADKTDPRFTDSRTPTPHAQSHAPGGSDPIVIEPPTATAVPFTAKPGIQAGNVQAAIEAVQAGAASGRTAMQATIDQLVAGAATMSTALTDVLARLQLLESTYAPVTDGVTWTLVSADEFNGSSIDAAKWLLFSSSGNGDGTFVPANVVVVNGEMQVKGLGDTGGGVAMKVGQTYGRWETRMKLDVGKGYSPVVALWPDSDSQADGEIRFFETLNGAANTGTITLRKPNNPTDTSKQHTYTIAPGEWHVWAVEWLPNRLTFYVDGLKVYEVTDPAFIPTKGFHFVAHLESSVGSTRTGIPARDSSTPQPLILHIDYARAYKTDVTIPGTGADPGDGGTETPPDPAPTTDARKTAVTAAMGQFMGEYVRSDGGVLEDVGTNRITSMSQANGLFLAALKKDQPTYDKIHNFGLTKLKRSVNNKSTAVNMWVASYSTSTNAVTDASFAAGGDYQRVLAYKLAIDAWNRQSDRDALLALEADLDIFTANADEGRLYQVTDEWQKIEAAGFNGHHVFNGSQIFEQKLSDNNPAAYKILKALTGKAKWDQMGSGHWDSLTKATDNAGGLATTTGLPPEWNDYSVTQHDVGAITTGTRGWSYSRSTDATYEYPIVIHRAALVERLWNDGQARSYLTGPIRTFLLAEIARAGKVAGKYTHAGAVISGEDKLTHEYAAYESIVTGDPTNSVAANIKATKLTNLPVSNAYGSYLRSDPPSATATSTYYGNFWMIVCEALDLGMLSSLATAFPAAPTTGGGTGGTGGGTTTPPPPPPTSPTGMWVDPINFPLQQAQVYASQGRTGDANLMQRMGEQPVGIWIGDWGGMSPSILSGKLQAAAALQQEAFIIVYNIVGRDNGHYSAGGAQTIAAYKAWIDGYVAACAPYAEYVTAVIEPDALADLTNVAQGNQAGRIECLQYACSQFKAIGCHVSMDAGHSNWNAASIMAGRLQQVGTQNFHTFALNTSNNRPQSEILPFGSQLSGLMSGMKAIIDTSRNGADSGGDWCNPPGMKFGPTPTFNTGISWVYAFHWLKRVGESDGFCNGGPSAGAWWPEYALDIARRTWGTGL